MDKIKSSRAGYAGAITRVLNKQSKLLDSNPTKFDIAYFKKQIESVQSNNTSFVKLHGQLFEQYPDKINVDQELQTLDSHEDNMAETLSVLQRLNRHENYLHGCYLF